MLNSEYLRKWPMWKRKYCDWMRLSTGILVSPVDGELLRLSF